ncbi:unnamed protein product, partial [Owenia fusiformis]
EPVFTAGSGPEFYIRGSDREEQKCPFGQVFVLESCCCEFEFVPVAPCDDTSSFYFADPDGDGCCTYVQCFANRTGYDTLECMPPSVWNDEEKACDIVNNVMDCMNVNCGLEMTDPPCDGSGQGTCCRAGNYYSEGGDNTQYIITDGPGASDRAECCPLNMDGEQLVFNFDEEVCCCELPSF